MSLATQVLQNVLMEAVIMEEKMEVTVEEVSAGDLVVML
jgi:hypothetical protein